MLEITYVWNCVYVIQYFHSSQPRHLTQCIKGMRGNALKYVTRLNGLDCITIGLPSCLSILILETYKNHYQFIFCLSLTKIVKCSTLRSKGINQPFWQQECEVNGNWTKNGNVILFFQVRFFQVQTMFEIDVHFRRAIDMAHGLSLLHHGCSTIRKWRDSIP